MSDVLVFAGWTPTVLATESLLHLVLFTILTHAAGPSDCPSSIHVGNCVPRTLRNKEHLVSFIELNFTVQY